MIRWLLYLFAAPVVFVLPWLPSAIEKQWLAFFLWSAAWLGALWVTTELWAGPGLLGLMSLGIAATIHTRWRL